MGRLLTRSDIDADATWYFHDAYYSSSNGPARYVYEWPSQDFPFHIYIHNDTLYQHNGRKIEIRRWIEHTLTDVVILDSIEMNYRKYYGKSYEWEKSYEVSNRWIRFSFENDHSASMFALVFSEWIHKQPTIWHPEKPEDEEYLNRPEEERYAE